MSNQFKPMQTITNKEMDMLLANIQNSSTYPIRNIKNTEFGAMPNIPKEYKPLVPGHALLDYKVDFGAKRGKQERSLTAKECNDLLGVSAAVKMNFIPQMITSLVMQQATKLVNYCRDNRVSETKKHTRLIKLAIEEYAHKLKDAYGVTAFRAYVEYVQRFKDKVATNIWLMESHADTLCRNQAPGKKHYPIYVRTLIIVMLIRYSQQYDRNMDKLLTDKIGIPVRQREDIYQQTILAMCISISDDFGYKIEPDETMGNWVKIISNQAYYLADDIITEESAN